MDRKFYTCLLLIGFVLQIALAFPSGETEDLDEDDTQQQQQQSVDSESLAAFARSIKTSVKGTRRGGKLKEESTEESNDPCLERKRIGRCRAYLPRYYFDQKEGSCKRFGFGGCDSNMNNFEDLTTCESTCAKHLKIITVTPIPEERSVSSPNANVTSPSVCALPSEKGFCYAIKYQYFFNKENNRCERFEYGGCGGNGNRFNSAEECIRTCGGDSPADNPVCSEVSCPWSLYTHYKTLGCTAIYDGDACCPTRFDCPDQVQSNNTIDEGRSFRSRSGPQPEPISEIAESQPKCSYKGKLYNSGEMVNEASDSGSCRAACYCSDRQMQGPKIVCASIECPEHLGGIPPAKVGCLPLYKRDSCCAYDFYCPNDTLTIINPQLPEREPLTNTPEVIQCEVDGKKYYAGQRFYPEDSPCLKCLCQEGYNGSLTDEFCENVDCGIEIYYSDYLAKGCAPVYFQSPQGKPRCCPISWKCPEDNPQSIEYTPTSTPPTVRVPGSPQVISPSLVTPVPSKGNRSSRHYLTDEVCQLPKSVGVCKAIRLRYFYNKDTKACEEFTYTGCQGNDNNFASIRDCQGLCVPSNTASSGDNQPLGRGLDLTQARPQQPRGIYLSEQDPCTMGMKVGICKGYFPRYYYSPEDNACKPFIFGGCKGNGNNFYSKESCEATCTNSIPVQSLRSISSGGPPKSEGDASMVKFGEDGPSNGDGSSPTWVSTDPCTLPRLTGRCKGFFQRFFYDSQTGKCKEFVYGGCGGNDNNFSNMRSCERRCAATGSQSRILQIQPMPTTMSPNVPNADESNGPESKPPAFGFLERCNLPMKTGPCYGNTTAYYYNIDSKSCKSFAYGGCGGNANKFSSLAECEQICKISGSGPRRHTSQPDAEFIRDDNCNVLPTEGNCKGSYLRFHWDETLEQCLPFNYSGCGGNKNNFISESDCITICGKQPTIEELHSEGVLSCNFGTETLPIGSTVGGFKYSSEDIPCGVPVCQCLTPPSVTCIQTICPTPPPTTPQPVTSASNICTLPTCGSHCSQVDGPNGCPICECDDEHESQQQVVMEDFSVKSVKG